MSQAQGAPDARNGIGPRSPEAPVGRVRALGGDALTLCNTSNEDNVKDEDLRARLKELYLPPVTDFVLVDVPEMRFVMVDGRGGPDSPAFADAIKWLYAVIDPMKPFARK